MENKHLYTHRGQPVRIAMTDNGKYKIELYSNGAWHAPCSPWMKKFDAEAGAYEYFESVKDWIHG